MPPCLRRAVVAAVASNSDDAVAVAVDLRATHSPLLPPPRAFSIHYIPSIAKADKPEPPMAPASAPTFSRQARKKQDPIHGTRCGEARIITRKPVKSIPNPFPL
jgi:hypothetical protein